MLNRPLVALLLICATLVSCGRKPEKPLPPPPIKVKAITAQPGDIVQMLTVSGAIRFIANTTVSAEIPAQVKSIEVTDGRPVEKDQTLLVFNDTPFRAAVNQAAGNLQKDEATLDYNKAEWEKNAPLWKSGAISKSTYDQKYSVFQNSAGQVEADKGASAKAEDDLKHTTVTAPIKGVLSGRFVEKGDWVAVGGKLFQISDYTTVYLTAYVSDKDVGKLDFEKVIQKGHGIRADVTVDSLPGKTFEGDIRYIQAVTNQNHLFEVRIYINNKDMKLLEGMYARAAVEVNRIPCEVRIPIDTLLEQIRTNASNTVAVVDAQNKAQLTPIRIGAGDRTNAQVLSGLKPGDIIVVEGKEILSSGQPVEVTQLDGAPHAQPPAKNDT